MKDYPRHHQYQDLDDYARAFREYGGPRPGQDYYFPRGKGPHCDLMNAIYGENPKELAAGEAYQAKLEQSRRADIFVQKFDG